MRFDDLVLAVGEEYEGIICKLSKLGAKVIKVKSSPFFPKCERSHPDLRIYKVNSENVIIYKEDRELSDQIKNLGCNITYAKNNLCGKYPYSASLNAARIGNLLLCNKKYMDEEVIISAEKQGLEIVNCNQGYSRCATCIVSEDAVITADKSVYNALSSKKDVLLISSGNIKLNEKYDGMIGGASANIRKNEILFFGNIKLHPDFEKIDFFLSKHNVKYICLTEEMLVDVGTAIVLR